MLTADIIVLGAGTKRADAQKWVQPILDAFAFFKMPSPSPRVIAAFLANVGIETGGFSRLVENLNYDANGLARTWKNRYAVDPNAKVKVPNALAIKLANKPQEIANQTYGGRFGNGPAESGDGWKYRGRGLMQITFRDNYLAAGKALGLDLINNPDQLAEPEAAARSAVWYFVRKGCVPYAEAGDISKVVEIINGQPPCKANDGETRLSRFKDTVAALAS